MGWVQEWSKQVGSLKTAWEVHDGGKDLSTLELVIIIVKKSKLNKKLRQGRVEKRKECDVNKLEVSLESFIHSRKI